MLYIFRFGKSWEIQGWLKVVGAQGWAAGSYYCLTSYCVTEQVYAETEGGEIQSNNHSHCFSPTSSSCCWSLTISAALTWSQLGGMMLQEAWCSRGDRAPPWWQLPLHLLFDWLPKDEEWRGRGCGVSWLVRFHLVNTKEKSSPLDMF